LTGTLLLIVGMFDTAYMRELYRAGYSIGASKERWSGKDEKRSLVPVMHTIDP
jgi:hypothetical protein